jgi:hypothetical protein
MSSHDCDLDSSLHDVRRTSIKAMHIASLSHENLHCCTQPWNLQQFRTYTRPITRFNMEHVLPKPENKLVWLQITHYNPPSAEVAGPFTCDEHNQGLLRNVVAEVYNRYSAT